MTNTYTDLAIDAFRRQERARRLLAKAEAATLAAAAWLRTQPAEEFNRYVAETEKIRCENDAKEHPEVYAARMFPAPGRTRGGLPEHSYYGAG